MVIPDNIEVAILLENNITEVSIMSRKDLDMDATELCDYIMDDLAYLSEKINLFRIQTKKPKLRLIK